MKKFFVLAAALAAAPVLADQITLYEGPNMRGRSVSLNRTTPNLGYLGFENRASSAYITDGRWELCTEPYFKGQCRTYGPGQQPSLGGQSYKVSSARIANDGLYDPPPDDRWSHSGDSEVVVYDRQNFSNQLRTLREATPNFDPLGFNDAVASLVVRRGTWQFCTDAYYRGECVTYGPGRYPSLPGKDDRFSSARPVQGGWGGGGNGGWGGSGGNWGNNQGGGNWGGGGGGGGWNNGNDYGSPRIRLFEHGNFGGRSVWLERTTTNFDRMGFNDRAESVIVEGGSWRLCSDANGRGECETFGPGQYPSLPRGLASKVSSAYVR